MNASTVVVVVLIVATFVGLIVTCHVDQAGLADAKYGPRTETPRDTTGGA